MYDYRISAAGQIGSTINTSGIPHLHAASSASASGYGAAASQHDASLTTSLLSGGERTEADGKVKGAANEETKPWQEYCVEPPDLTDPFVSCDKLRKNQESKDKEFLYSASAGIYSLFIHLYAWHGMYELAAHDCYNRCYNHASEYG
jgi:hypothetical protein